MGYGIDEQTYQSAHQSPIDANVLKIFTHFQLQFLAQFIAFPVANGIWNQFTKTIFIS